MIVTERIARKFDSIIIAERAVRTADALATFGSDAGTRARAAANLATARQELFSLIGSLNGEESAEFGVYRLSSK